MQADHICKMESEMLDIYLLPPGEDPETCPSWLRMRNRDGRYDLRFEEWVVEDPFVISPRISFEVPLPPPPPKCIATSDNPTKSKDIGIGKKTLIERHEFCIVNCLWMATFHHSERCAPPPSPPPCACAPYL